jgi:hypothetical protein
VENDLPTLPGGWLGMADLLTLSLAETIDVLQDLVGLIDTG